MNQFLKISSEISQRILTNHQKIKFSISFMSNATVRTLLTHQSDGRRRREPSSSPSPVLRRSFWGSTRTCSLSRRVVLLPGPDSHNWPLRTRHDSKSNFKLQTRVRLVSSANQRWTVNRHPSSWNLDSSSWFLKLRVLFTTSWQSALRALVS